MDLNPLLNSSRKTNVITNNPNTPPEFKTLSEGIEHLKTISKSEKNYNENTFKAACKQCLTKWETDAKFRLADLALEFQNLYVIAGHIWEVLDDHFSNVGFHKQYFSSHEGLKELTQQPNCGTAACLYGFELLTDNGVSENKDKGWDSLDIALQRGNNLAFQIFQSKQPNDDTPSFFSPLPLKYASRIQPETYIKKAQDFLHDEKPSDAVRELERAASLRKITITKLGDEFEKENNLDMALLCFEKAAESEDQEALTKYINIKKERAIEKCDKNGEGALINLHQPNPQRTDIKTPDKELIKKEKQIAHSSSNLVGKRIPLLRLPRIDTDSKLGSAQKNKDQVQDVMEKKVDGSNNASEETDERVDEVVIMQSEDQKIDQQEVKEENKSELPPILQQTTTIPIVEPESEPINFNSPPTFNNLFPGNNSSIKKVKVQQPAKQTDNPTSHLTATSSSQSAITTEVIIGNIDQGGGDTTDNSTNFILLFLLFAVPFSAVLVHNYYTRKS